MLLAWGGWELRVEEPLVDLRTTARRQVLVTNLASIAVGFAMFAMSLVIPQLLQLPEATGYGLGKSLLVAGLTMAPSGLVMMATAPASAALSKAKGPKITLMVGALAVAAGYGLNIVLMSELWQVLTEPAWAKKLSDEDRRDLTALFWSNVTPYGTFRPDMAARIDLGPVVVVPRPRTSAGAADRSRTQTR